MAELQLPEPPSAPAVETALITRTKEVSKDTQTNETKRVGKASLLRRGKEVAHAIPKEQWTQADKDLGVLYMAFNPAIDDYGAIDGTKGVDLIESNPNRKVILKTKGADGTEKKIHVATIGGFDGKNFWVYQKDARTGLISTYEPKVSMEDLQRAIIESYGDSILTSTRLSPAEKTILNHYFALQKGQTVDALGNSELNAIITQAADSVGLPTTSDVEGFAASEAGKPIANALLEAVKSVNVLDKPTFIRVMAEAGMTPSSLTDSINAAQGEVDKKQALLDANPGNPQVKAELAQAKLNLALIKQAQEALGENGAVGNYIDRAEAGEVDLTTAIAMKAALKRGDAKAMIEAVVEPLPGETPEDTANRKTMYLKYAKTTGLFGLLALLLVGFGATKILEGVGGGR